MRLSDGLRSRTNNYNLIRLVAASSVFLSHAFTVVTGNAQNEPLRTSFGLTWGSIAVDVFFVISGLLVTSSMRRSDSAVDFVVARFLRIWPGLAVSLLALVVLAAAVFYKTVIVADAAHYAWRNALPVGRMYPGVQGVFDHNPAGFGFNASLWTLPFEVRMYRDVLLLWLVSFAFLRHRRVAFDVLVLLAATYFSFKFLVLNEHVSVEEAPDRLAYMFFVGSAALVLARWIRLEPIGVAGALAAIVVSALLGRSALFFGYGLLLWYVILGLAYLPRGRILKFNGLGDYSYGVYIYAWPIQQFAVALLPGRSVWQNVAVTAPVILCFAIASWHVVESPALRLKARLIRRR